MTFSVGLSAFPATKRKAGRLMLVIAALNKLPNKRKMLVTTAGEPIKTKEINSHLQGHELTFPIFSLGVFVCTCVCLCVCVCVCVFVCV